MTLGSRIRKRRGELGWNQTELANAMEVVPSMISRLESGIIRNHKLSTVKKLAKNLNTTLDYLAGRSKQLELSDTIDSDPVARSLLKEYLKKPTAQRKELYD